MSRLIHIGVFCLCSSLLSAQSISAPFAQISIGTDGLTHITDGTGQETPISKRNGQVGVSMPRLSSDKQFAGWMIEENNCCTSYPIPTSVAIYSSTRTFYLHDEKMVVGWCFVPGKAQVVLATETVHGWTKASDLHLYSARTGRLRRRWSGEIDEKQPSWANCLNM